MFPLARRALLAGCCLLVLLAARPARPQVTAEDVKRAIDMGVEYLKRNQSPRGSWPNGRWPEGGVTALCTLALLNAGVGPDDPQVALALQYLRGLQPDWTYAVALQTMVFCAAEPRKDARLILRNVRWLESAQLRSGENKGAWSYVLGRGGGDNSNSQFAVLALYEAERAGISASEQTWRLALDYWERAQNADGSWGYLNARPGASGSMTAAGIAALVMCADKLYEPDVEIDNDRIRCCRTQQQQSRVENGLRWLGGVFTVRSNPGQPGGGNLLYYLYGLERVGRLTNQRFIGGHDWYREGAELLVAAQDRDLSGLWKGVGHGEDDPLIGTSLALLFLSKGRRPVLAAKLKHQPLDDWNRHRSDLANLTSYTEKRWSRDLTWQVIDLAAATADDLLEAPVLYLSGSLPPEIGDQGVRQLRAYVDRGGFILAVACCGDEGFDEAFRQLVKQIFPEPEYDLHLLPPEHPIWSAEERVDPQFLPPLYGVDASCRTSLIYCPEDLSCLWEAARTGRQRALPDALAARIQAALSVGINIMAYATNREVKFKLDPSRKEDLPEQDDAFDRAKLFLAELKHRGGWDATPRALATLVKSLSHEAGLRASAAARALELTDDDLFQYHMLVMHGRNAFRLSDEERAMLREYIERGGFLFADAVCSSPQFIDSFRREMAAAFPGLRLEPIPPDHPLFTPQYGGTDIRSVKRRDPQQRTTSGQLRSQVRQVPPELEGIRLGDRYGVIFSPYDLSCALEKQESLECPGYTRDDAARIGLNIILYSLHQ
jgi:hypothetical protein